MTTKQDIIEMIERMPDNAPIEDILYEVYSRAKVEAGLRDLDEGRTASHEDVVRNLNEWGRTWATERQ